MCDHKIIFARVFYQRKVKSSVPLTEKQERDLQLVAFPKEKVTDAEFRKIFPFGENIAVSAKNAISSRDLVPTAEVIIFAPNTFDTLCRDIFSIFDFLARVSEKKITKLNVDDFITSPEINNSLLKSKSSFENFISRIKVKFGNRFLAEVLSTFLVHREISITPKTHPHLKDTLTAIYLLSPISKITSTTLVLYEGAEEKFYKFGSLKSEIESPKKGPLGIFKTESLPSVNLDEKKVFNGDRFEFIDVTVSEFFDEPWYNFDKFEHYRFLVNALDSLLAGKKIFDVFQTSKKLKEMRNTFTRLEDFNNSLIRSGKKLVKFYKR